MAPSPPQRRARSVAVGVAVAVATLLVGLLAACGTGPVAAPSAPTTAPTTGRTPSRATSPTSTPTRPNVVFILTDDQTLDEMSVMPQTQALIGDRGTTFDHALSQYPLCCPARATLLTGQLPHNNGVLGNDEPWGGYGHFDESSTLPIWLQAAGYHTGIVGKYLNGYPEIGGMHHVPPGWDEWHAPVDGIYDYEHFTTNDDGVLHTHARYQADYVGAEASRMIREFSGLEAPFYVWAGFLGPHMGGPIEPDDPLARDPNAIGTPAVDPKYRDTANGDLLPTEPSRPERDDSDKVPYLQGKAPFPPGDLQEFSSQRHEALHSVDDAVARIMGTLRRTGHLDDTMVVFTSDNGFLIGEHNVVNKIYGYEESIRVPLLMEGPGLERGVVRHQLVSLTDVAPTVEAVSGAVPGTVQDGLSLLPFAASATHGAHRDLLLEAGGAPFPKVTRLYQGIRTWDGHVLLHWYDGWTEVYDLATDPYELDGTVSASERRYLPSLRRRLARLVACVGIACDRQ